MTPRISDADALEAVAFDAYGTLFDITGEDWAAPAVVQTFRAKQLQYSWLVSLMLAYRDFDDLSRAALEYAAAAHAVEVDVEAVLQRQRRIHTFAEVPAALERIGVRGARRLAILSNGRPDSLAALVANNGLEGIFAAIVSVHPLRVFKPSPRVYQRALDELAVARAAPLRLLERLGRGRRGAVRPANGLGEPHRRAAGGRGGTAGDCGARPDRAGGLPRRLGWLRESQPAGRPPQHQGQVVLREGDRALRTTFNDSYDFEIGRKLRNLPTLIVIGIGINRRLLELERQSCRATPAASIFEALLGQQLLLLTTKLYHRVFCRSVARLQPGYPAGPLNRAWRAYEAALDQLIVDAQIAA